MHAGSLEALRVTRPEAVDLERIKANRVPPRGFVQEACTRKAAMACGKAIVCIGPSCTVGFFVFGRPLPFWTMSCRFCRPSKIPVPRITIVDPKVGSDRPHDAGRLVRLLTVWRAWMSPESGNAQMSVPRAFGRQIHTFVIARFRPRSARVPDEMRKKQHVASPLDALRVRRRRCRGLSVNG